MGAGESSRVLAAEDLDALIGVRPDNAVVEIGAPGEAYAIDCDYRKGWGLCAAERPCGAIEMIPEVI